MLRNTLVAAMMMAFCGGVGAAGLGRINVLSSLGQPLRAEVELTASPEELESMVARLASAEAFKRANVEYLSAFSGVKMAIEKKAGKSILKISTDRPFNEPFVDILVDLNWVGGRLQRGYTFLLDPVDDSSRKPVASVAEPVSTPVQKTERVAAPSSAVAREPAPAVTPKAEAPGEYTVQRGDTLSKIAREFKSLEVSQDQMLAALYRANSDSFIGGNINRLRAGRILKVPESSVAADISKREARQIVLKASNFEQYRQAVAAAATASPAKDSGGGQSASGKIAPVVEEKAVAAQQSKDKVKVTAAEGKSSASGDAATKARMQALQDDIAAREKALKEANSRVADLEKNVRELQKLIEMKNQGLAEAQKQATSAQSANKAAETRIEQLEKDKAKAAKDKQAEKPAIVEQSKPEPEVKPEPAAVVSAPEVEQSAAPVAEVSVPVIEASAPAVVQSAPVVTAAPAPAALPPVEEEGLFSNLWAILGLAGVAGAVGYVVMKQRRKQAAAGSGNTQMTEASTTSPNSVFGSAGGQTVDTGGTSLLHTDFSQSGMSAIDADEGVDPVAEADVYMAYGRDAQAEEILLDALKNDPSRTAVYLKLLEIYAQRKSLKQFENIATDLYTQTAGVGEDWSKAAAMGVRLDPNNPLYKMAAAGAAVAAVAEQAPAIPEEIDLPVDEPPAEETPAVSFGTNNISQVRSTWTVPGDINKFTSTEGEMPVLVEPELAPAVVPVPESLNLDFNLDLDTPLSEDQPTELESREEETPVELTDTDVEGVSQAEEAPLEFDIGLDEEPAPVSPAAASPVETLEDDFDIGIESTGDSKPLAEVDLEKTNFEGSLLDFDFELGEETNTKPTMDLSGVSLQSSSAAAPSLTASVIHEPIQDNIDVNEEVSTKLELAKAYEEMGDIEGARELLEEVISDGADFQKDQAKTILGRLG